jgi:arginyl-tRNA synthetase
VITAGLRRAILAAAGLEGAEDGDPLLRPGPVPGSYASSLPFRLAQPGQNPREKAAALAGRLTGEPWIAAAEVTGPGFLTVTVTHDALAGLAVRIARAGPACAHSDALRGRVVPAAPPGSLAAAPGWPQAQAAFAAQLTVRLAAAAGATVFPDPERASVPAPAPPSAAQPEGRSAAQPMALPGHGPVAEAAWYAGADAVRFVLARMRPGGSVSSPAPEATVIARQVLANPAYAVRYAHAAAAAVLRWAAALGTRPAGFTPRLLAEPGELALLDALSWLPERVAMAARRGRPDEFAGYLEELAARTIETMSTTSFTTISSISSERLWLADAARTGLAVGLGLLEIGAPGRL